MILILREKILYFGGGLLSPIFAVEVAIDS
jgi:hypothetical protein